MHGKQILSVVFACISTAAVGQEVGIRPKVPVIINHSSEGYDPCYYGRVHGLDPQGEGFLAVKTGPGLSYERLDKLKNGEVVWICGEKGEWYAIVYSRVGRNCNVEENWSKTLPYRGPCRSGWAHKRWIEPISS